MKRLALLVSICTLLGRGLLWKLQLPGRIYYSSPVLFSGALFQPVRDYWLFKINPENGKVLGKVRLGPWTKSTPELASGLLLLTRGDQLMAINPRSLEVAWKTTLFPGLVASPAFLKGRIFVGSIYQRFYALSPKGKLLWSFPVARGIYCKAVAWRELICTGDIGGNLYCWSPKGKLRCHLKLSRKGNTCPAGGGDVLLVSSGKKLAAVDPEGCRIVREFKFREDIIPAPLLKEGKVFICPGNEILALELSTGRVLWHFPTGARVVGRPALDDSVLYAGSSDGFLYAIDTEKGELLWKERLSGPTYSSPLVLKDRVIIPDIPGNLWCFRR